MGQARETVERFYELFAAGRIAESTALYAEDCITVMPGAGGLSQSEHEQMGHAFKTAAPDARMVIEKVVENGEEIVVVGRFAGTHTGPMVSPSGEIPASGNTLDLRFADYFRVRDGLVVDHQVLFDQMELLGQLGALPAPV
jgi:steroid delta-isomerase-like uncharacterized protein